MFSDLTGVREALKTRLAPLLPADWRIEPNLIDPPAEYLKPLLTFEFTKFESTANGQPLPPGTVAALVDLVLGSPMTKNGPGEDDVDELAHTLVRAVDAQSDMFWDTSEKQRLPAGQWIWRIHTTVLTTTPAAAPEEPEE